MDTQQLLDSYCKNIKAVAMPLPNGKIYVKYAKPGFSPNTAEFDTVEKAIDLLKELEVKYMVADLFDAKFKA